MEGNDGLINNQGGNSFDKVRSLALTLGYHAQEGDKGWTLDDKRQAEDNLKTELLQLSQRLMIFLATFSKDFTAVFRHNYPYFN